MFCDRWIGSSHEAFRREPLRCQDNPRTPLWIVSNFTAVDSRCGEKVAYSIIQCQLLCVGTIFVLLTAGRIAVDWVLCATIWGEQWHSLVLVGAFHCIGRLSRFGLC